MKGRNPNGGNVIDLDAAAGNDLVDTTAMPAGFYLTAVLGAGSDTFVGGPGSDTVIARAPKPDAQPNDGERDVIDTGAGTDDVTSGVPGLANSDVVRTGNGDDDVTWSGVMGGDGVLDAGAGHDLFYADAPGQTFRIDLDAQTLTRDGVLQARFNSFESLYVSPEPGLGTVQAVGSEGDDVINLGVGAFEVQADLRGGDDYLGHGNFDSDTEQGYDCAESRVTLRGGAGNDDIKGRVRSERIYGGAGNDNIFTGPAGVGVNKAWGGKGKDVLKGGGDKDVLLGGAGRDKADGGKSRDRCAAEIEKLCEG